MVFIISEPEIEKSHVDMVSVSNLKMEATIATVLKTAAQMNLVFVSNLKSQVRFFIQIQTQSNWPISSYRPYFGTQKINHSSKSRISLILNASKKIQSNMKTPPSLSSFLDHLIAPSVGFIGQLICRRQLRPMKSLRVLYVIIMQLLVMFDRPD